MDGSVGWTEISRHIVEQTFMLRLWLDFPSKPQQVTLFFLFAETQLGPQVFGQMWLKCRGVEQNYSINCVGITDMNLYDIDFLET